MTFDPTEKCRGRAWYILARERRLGQSFHVKFYARWTSFDTKGNADCYTGNYRDYYTRGLLDTKPTPETASMPVRVDVECLYIEMFHVGIADLELSQDGKSAKASATRNCLAKCSCSKSYMYPRPYIIFDRH